MKSRPSYHKLAEIAFMIFLIVIISITLFLFLQRSWEGVKTPEDHIGLTEVYNALEFYHTEQWAHYIPEKYTRLMAGSIMIAGQAILWETDFELLGVDSSKLARRDSFGYSFNKDASLAMVFVADSQDPEDHMAAWDDLGIYYYDEKYLSGAFPWLWVDILWEAQAHISGYFPDIEQIIQPDEALLSYVFNRDSSLLANPNLANLDESLELYLDMKTIGTSGRMIDLSGNTRHGLCFDASRQVICGNGGPKLSLEGAFLFDGLDDYIELDTNFSLPGESGYTIAVRARLSDSQFAALAHENTLVWNYCSTDYVFGKVQERGQKEEYQGFSLQITSREVEYIDSFQEQIILNQEDTNAGEYFVIASFDSQNNIADFWIARGEGELIHSSRSVSPDMFTDSACPLRIAKNYGHTSLYDNFDGKIYDVRVYSRPLSDAEAQTLYSIEY